MKNQEVQGTATSILQIFHVAVALKHDSLPVGETRPSETMSFLLL